MCLLCRLMINIIKKIQCLTFASCNYGSICLLLLFCFSFSSVRLCVVVWKYFEFFHIELNSHDNHLEMDLKFEVKNFHLKRAIFLLGLFVDSVLHYDGMQIQVFRHYTVPFFCVKWRFTDLSRLQSPKNFLLTSNYRSSEE